LPEVPPDTRPIGSLLYADQSSLPFASNIHLFDPLGKELNPEMAAHIGAPHGIRTVDKRMLRYYDPHRAAKENDE